MVTGESMPVRKRSGDNVIGGTVNGTGSFVMRAEGVGRETLLAQIVRMVGEAQRAARRSNGWPITSPVILFRSSSSSPWLRSSSGRFRARAVARLRARQRGRGADHRLPVRTGSGDADVDHGRHRSRRTRPACSSRTPRPSRVLEKVDTLVVDKTGTLTEGKPRLVVRRAAARAVMKPTCCVSPRASNAGASIRWPPPSSPAPKSGRLDTDQCGAFQSLTGRGVAGTVDGHAVRSATAIARGAARRLEAACRASREAAPTARR